VRMRASCRAQIPAQPLKLLPPGSQYPGEGHNITIGLRIKALAFFSLSISVASLVASSSSFWIAKLEREGATVVSGGPTDGVEGELAAGDVDDGDAEVVEQRDHW